MGVEFVDVTDELRDRIARFVEQLRRELPDTGRVPGPVQGSKPELIWPPAVAGVS